MSTITTPAQSARRGLRDAFPAALAAPSSRVEEDEDDLYGDDDLEFDDEGLAEEDDTLEDEDFDETLED